MEQTVYGDLLFFVNFCMDFQCLFLTAKLLRRPFRLWRCVLSAALGALYACAALFLTVSGVLAFACDLLVCFLMCVLAYWEKRCPFWRLLLPFGLYFGVSFAIGGVMSGMATLLSRLQLPLQGTSAQSSISFFLLAALGGACTFLWGRFSQRRARGTRATLTLVLEEKELTVEGLVDTANLLCDPVGGRCVVVLDRRVALEWLPPALGRATAQGAAGVAALPERLARRVRLIPASSVTGHALLVGIAPDGAFLDFGKGARPVELLVAPAALSADMGECKALLPAALLSE